MKRMPLLPILALAQLLIFYSSSLSEENERIAYMDSCAYYQKKQDFKNAIIWGEKALEAMEKETDKKDSVYTLILSNLTNAYILSGNLEKGFFYARQDSAISYELYGENHEQYAAALNILGYIYQENSDYQTALSIYNKALDIYELSPGKASEEYALSLNNIGTIYSDMQQFEEAGRIYKEALDIRRRLYSGDNINLATSINNLGYVYDMAGKYQEAEKYYIETLEMMRRLYTGDNNDLAMTINNLAAFYAERSRYREAEELYLEAVAMRRRLFDYDHVDKMVVISNLAYFYQNTGHYDKAGPLFKEAIDMGRRLYKGDNLRLAGIIGNMGSHLESIGKFDEAESYHIEALEMKKRIYGYENFDVALSLNNLAVFYYKIGRTSETEKNMLHIVAIYQKMLQGAEHPILASIWGNLATLYENKGYFDKAEEYYRKSIDVYRRFYNGDHIELAISISNIANLYTKMGRYEAAEEKLLESFEMRKRLFKDDHNHIAQSLNNLGVYYDITGQYEKAEKYYLKSIDMFRRLYNGAHPELASILDNISVYYSARKMYDKAMKYNAEGREMMESYVGNDNPGLAKIFFNTAGIYKDLRDYEKALNYYDSTDNILRKHFDENHLDLGKSLLSRAELFYYNKKYKDAALYFKKGLKIYLTNTFKFLKSFSENEMLQFVKTFEHKFDMFNAFSIRAYKEMPELMCEMFNYKLATKVLLLSSVKKVKDYILRSGDSILIDKYQQWTDMKEYLSKLYKLSDERLKELKIDISAYEDDVNELEKYLTKESLAFKKEYSSKQYSWTDVRNRLKEGEAAIEIIKFFNFDKIIPKDTILYAALIITPDSKKRPDIVIIGNGKYLENECFEKFREITKKSVKEKELLNQQKELYRVFWGKINTRLNGATTVYLSVEGIYNKINLNVLINPETNKLLLNELDIRLITTTRELVESAANEGKSGVLPLPGKSILFGDPQYNLDSDKYSKFAERYIGERETLRSVERLNPEEISRKGISRLPGTRVEIEQISDRMNEHNWENDIFMGPKALEEAIKSINNPKALHIATHGLFLKDNARKDNYMGIQKKALNENPLLRSMLLFAGAENSIIKNKNNETQYDDGLLTAYEAMNLRLEGTELVVLSACETGLGEIRNDHGVFGLQRAFRVAGAKETVN